MFANTELSHLVLTISIPTSFYLRGIWDTQSGLSEVTRWVSSGAIGLNLFCGWLSFVQVPPNHATLVNLGGLYGGLLHWWPPLDNAYTCGVPLSLNWACPCDLLEPMNFSRWDAGRHMKSVLNWDSGCLAFGNTTATQKPWLVPFRTRPCGLGMSLFSWDPEPTYQLIVATWVTAGQTSQGTSKLGLTQTISQ